MFFIYVDCASEPLIHIHKKTLPSKGKKQHNSNSTILCEIKEEMLLKYDLLMETAEKNNTTLLYIYKFISIKTKITWK